MNDLVGEPLPPHLALFTLLSQLCQHNFFLQRHCEAHRFGKKQSGTHTMMLLLEAARLPDRIYSTPTIAVAEIQKAMCCEASAGKSRGVGIFEVDVDSTDTDS